MTTRGVTGAFMALALFACSEPEVEGRHPSGMQSADACAQCHPLQAEEWRGSIMHYAAVSPVFNAFELALREISEGAIAPNGSAPAFCVKCHSPIAVRSGEIADWTGAGSARPVRSDMSELGLEGITCDFCHSVSGPDLQASPTGDGISNTSLSFASTSVKRGPFGDTYPEEHGSVRSDYLANSTFCGACHDVRFPKPDVLLREPFQRVENLFSEWLGSSYAFDFNPFGRVLECQDCHMSLYPLAPPGTFPTARIAVGDDLPERKHKIHAFTAVSVPLIDDPRFPNVDTEALDDFGYPRGQAQRRELMLRAACSITLEQTPAQARRDDPIIPVRVTVTNVGAGHRVPSGFSEERQVWIHLVVSDDAGVLYESGYLTDRAHPETGEDVPDGRLDDEDLQARHHLIDPATLSVEDSPGPDVNLRPQQQLGLASFTNAFQRLDALGFGHDVVNPLQADTIDTSRALLPLVPRTILYDIPTPRAPVGDLRVQAKLRYRAFPPDLLRALAQRHPELVTEAMIDRNTIVDMAEITGTIRVVE